jgi:hypothetical protein
VQHEEALSGHPSEAEGWVMVVEWCIAAEGPRQWSAYKTLLSMRACTSDDSYLLQVISYRPGPRIDLLLESWSLLGASETTQTFENSSSAAQSVTKSVTISTDRVK